MIYELESITFRYVEYVLEVLVGCVDDDGESGEQMEQDRDLYHCLDKKRFLPINLLKKTSGRFIESYID